MYFAGRSLAAHKIRIEIQEIAESIHPVFIEGETPSLCRNRQI